MTSERSKRRDFLTLVFISKSISKKLLIKNVEDNWRNLSRQVTRKYKLHVFLENLETVSLEEFLSWVLKRVR